MVRPIASHNFNNINNNNEKREEAAMGLLVYWFYSLCSRYGFLPSLGSSMLALYTSLFFSFLFFLFLFPFHYFTYKVTEADSVLSGNDP